MAIFGGGGRRGGGLDLLFPPLMANLNALWVAPLTLARVPYCAQFPSLSLRQTLVWWSERQGMAFLYHHQTTMARNIKNRQKVANYTPSDQGYNPEEKERREEEEEERRRAELTGMEKRIL